LSGVVFLCRRCNPILNGALFPIQRALDVCAIGGKL
jgi:hypothetical protein